MAELLAAAKPATAALIRHAVARHFSRLAEPGEIELMHEDADVSRWLSVITGLDGIAAADPDVRPARSLRRAVWNAAHAAIAARGRAILPEHIEADEPGDPSLPGPGYPLEELPLRALLAEVERRHNIFPDIDYRLYA